jgi:hypothetical protein
MNKQLSCKERIEEELENRLEDFRLFDKILNNTPVEDFTEDEIELLEGHGYTLEDYENEDIDGFQLINEYGLSLELEDINIRTGEVKIKWCLSWGGPADYFNFTCSKVNSRWWDIDEIEYQFQDWYDNAVINLYGDDKEVLKNTLIALIDLDSFIDNEIDKFINDR